MEAKLESFQSQLNAEGDWATILSVGEQQKLMLARVFVHRPSLVFLDESTSGVPEEDEEAIYRHLIRNNIQIVSVAHRNNLRKFHSRFLELKPNGRFDLSSTSD